MTVNVLLDITAIPGESTLQGYSNLIQLQSFNHGIAQAINRDPSNTTRTLGRPDVAEISVTKVTDSSTTGLIQACLTGQQLNQVLLHVLRVSASEATTSHSLMMTYTLQNTLISSHSISGGGNDTPFESFTLNFTKVQVEYFVQGVDAKKEGTKQAVYDMATGLKS